LISGNIVLTAAHCIALHPHRALAFARATDLTDLEHADVVPAMATYIPQDFALIPRDRSMPLDDIGILVLSRSIEDVQVPVLSAAAVPIVGARWTMAGVSAGDAATVQGSESVGLAVITAVNDSEFTVAPIPQRRPCFGDSGGPVYAVVDPIVIGGVVSRAPIESDVLCASGAIYTRVDAHMKWINTVIQQTRVFDSRKSGAGCGSWQEVGPLWAP
jgi:secreted trypsin-like serine protease